MPDRCGTGWSLRVGGFQDEVGSPVEHAEVGVSEECHKGVWFEPFVEEDEAVVGQLGGGLG